MFGDGGPESRRQQLRLDLFTRIPEWQPEKRPRLALVWNFVVLLGLLSLASFMAWNSYVERPLVGTTGGWKYGIVRIPAMGGEGVSENDLLKPKRNQRVQRTACTCETAQGKDLTGAGCVEAVKSEDITVVVLANETAAPLAKDLLDEIKAEQVEEGKARFYSKDNIKMTIVEDRLGFTWSWNPSAYGSKELAPLSWKRRPAWPLKSL